jgi:hypothetical protein
MAFAEGIQNRRMLGPTLHEAIRESSPNQSANERRYCGVADQILNSVRGRTLDERLRHPETYDNGAEFVDEPYYRPDLGKVYSLMHSEYKPAALNDDAFCTAEGRVDPPAYCWFSSVTFVSSTNDFSKCSGGGNGMTAAGTLTPNLVGACFSHDDAPPPSHLVATIPYQYYADWGRNGYASHSNILKGEGENNYYFMASVQACLRRKDAQGNVYCDPTVTQKSGVCVLRTSNIADPSTWMAWNGSSFGNRPSGAYPPPADPSAHTCEPVFPSMQPWSLTYNRYLKKYMLLGHGTFTSAATGQSVTGVYYSLSEDFVNWSDPQLLMKAPTIHATTTDCNLDPISYPVVLDPNDPAASATGTQNPNFDHPGRTPDLYYRRSPRVGGGCTQGSGGVSRLPIQLDRQRQATFEDGSLTGPASGYDVAAGEQQGYLHLWSGAASAYEGQNYAQAIMIAGSTGYGSVNTKWKEGDDVWYGSAFYLPGGAGGVRASNDRLKIMSWDDQPGNAYGGVVLGSDDQYRLVRGRTGAGGSEDQIGFPFSLPENRWFWIEVHQRFSASGQAVNEVYVDGKLVTSSNSSNTYSGSNISHVRYGFIEPSTTNTAAWMNIDRSTVLGGERGALGAPKTPTGLRLTGSTSSTVTLSWNVVSGASGYRIYERNSNTTDGTWLLVADNIPASTTSATFSPCFTSDYRIVSFGTSGGVTKDSIFSSPVTASTSNC